jgi:hypothetical protein
MSAATEGFSAMISVLLMGKFQMRKPPAAAFCLFQDNNEIRPSRKRGRRGRRSRH